MYKTKTAVIFAMITLVIVIVGFVILFTRKQEITIGGETAEIKSKWGKDKVAAKTETPEKGED